MQKDARNTSVGLFSCSITAMTYIFCRYPEEGAQLSDFNSALESLLVTKLGEGDHSERIREIWRFADFNNDAKVKTKMPELWLVPVRNRI